MNHLSDDQIISRLGGPVKVARMCEITPQAVSMWRRNGIPRLRRQLLLLLNPDVFVDGYEPPLDDEQRERAAA